MRVPVFQFDAFSATAFGGNPAAVVLDGNRVAISGTAVKVMEGTLLI